MNCVVKACYIKVDNNKLETELFLLKQCQNTMRHKFHSTLIIGLLENQVTFEDSYDHNFY